MDASVSNLSMGWCKETYLLCTWADILCCRLPSSHFAIAKYEHDISQMNGFFISRKNRAPTIRDFREKSLLFKITLPGPGKVCEYAKSQKLRENTRNLSNNQSNVIVDVHKPCILSVTNCSTVQVLRRRSILIAKSFIAQIWTVKQSCKSYATFCSPFSVSTVPGRVWVCSKMYWIIQRLGHTGEPRSGTSIELASGEIRQLDNRFSPGFKHLRRRKFLFLELLSHMQLNTRER